jgi:hypothetical protein
MWENAIADLKKERFDSYTLIAHRNPSGRRKTFANNYDTPISRVREKYHRNRRGMDAFSDARSAVFGQRARKCAFLLPIWLPNPTLLPSEHNGLCRAGGRGGRPGVARQKCSIDNRAQNFTPNRPPCPVPLKKNALRDSGAIPSHLS